jgi:hypothetical protein
MKRAVAELSDSSGKIAPTRDTEIRPPVTQPLPLGTARPNAVGNHPAPSVAIKALEVCWGKAVRFVAMTR